MELAATERPDQIVTAIILYCLTLRSLPMFVLYLLSRTGQLSSFHFHIHYNFYLSLVTIKCLTLNFK